MEIYLGFERKERKHAGALTRTDPQNCPAACHDLCPTPEENAVKTCTKAATRWKRADSRVSDGPCTEVQALGLGLQKNHFPLIGTP